MSQKSILEQALLQVQTLEEAVKQNAKGILASTMKQELNDLLKEQAEEEELANTPDEEENDVTGTEPEDTEPSINDDETDTEDETSDDEEEPSMDDDSEYSDDEEEPASDDDTLDMTGASDDEVLKVFKKMKPEDGIVVKKDGDKIELSVDGEDYIISLDDEDDATEEDESFGINEDEMEEDAIYEITLDDEEGGEDLSGNYSQDDMSSSDDSALDHIEVSEEDLMSSEGESSEIEAMEAARTIGNGVRPPAQKTKFKAGRHEMNEEVETLKKQNSEYKKALVLFKEKLNEVAVFNANLAYFTNLVTENTTTKNEKLNILKRFDSVSTIKESKNLYNQIKTELETKKPVTESVVNKISTTPTSSAGTEVLSEAKAYENPQFKRMKDLMSKLK